MLKNIMCNELVSVVVPVYNVENYLEECINSILNQTYKNIEIILVDDGSTDASGIICDSFSKVDNRIFVIHKKNGGLSDARNVGIENSHGEYISLIDSDDVVCENFIQTLYETQKLTGSDVVCCELICFYDEDKTQLRQYWDRINLNEAKFMTYNHREAIEKSFYQHISITGAPQKLYRKRLFEQIHFPKGRYFEDLATTFLFFEKSNHVSVINKKLYGYRMRVDSIMNHSFNRRKMDCIWVGNRIISYYEKSNIRGTKCAAFRVNRLIYDQIPHSYKDEKEKVWDEIKKYRKSVICDKNVQHYEKIIALSSYSGKYMFNFWLLIFRKLRKMKYKNSL